MNALWKTSWIALCCGTLFAGCGDGEVVDDDDDIDVTPNDGGGANDGGSGGDGGTADGGDGGSIEEGGSGGDGSEDGGSGGTDAGTDEPDASTDPGDLMCDLEEDDLNSCDLCVRQSCCDELVTCSESGRCSGEPTDDGFATGDFGALQECIDVRYEEDGFVDRLTVEYCAEDVDAGEDAMALSDCILDAPDASSDAGPGDSCAFSCFGIVE